MLTAHILMFVSAFMMNKAFTSDRCRVMQEYPSNILFPYQHMLMVLNVLRCPLPLPKHIVFSQEALTVKRNYFEAYVISF